MVSPWSLPLRIHSSPTANGRYGLSIVVLNDCCSGAHRSKSRSSDGGALSVATGATSAATKADPRTTAQRPSVLAAGAVDRSGRRAPLSPSIGVSLRPLMAAPFRWILEVRDETGRVEAPQDVAMGQAPAVATHLLVGPDSRPRHRAGPRMTLPPWSNIT